MNLFPDQAAAWKFKNVSLSMNLFFVLKWYLLEMLRCAIIEKNSHLVRNEDDLKYFEAILSAIAAHQYQKESWFSSNSKH